MSGCMYVVMYMCVWTGGHLTHGTTFGSDFIRVLLNLFYLNKSPFFYNIFFLTDLL